MSQGQSQSDATGVTGSASTQIEAPAQASQAEPLAEDTLLTREEEPKTAGPGEAQKETEVTAQKEADPATLVPEKAEEYQLAYPEGASIDTALEGSFRQEAHKLGLSQAQAQALATLYAGHVAQSAQAQTESFRQAKAEWEGQIKASPTFAEDKVHAQAFLKAFGDFDNTGAVDKELIEVINETMVGSHPKIFKLLANAGKLLAEPGMKGKGSNNGGGLNFYPTMSGQ